MADINKVQSGPDPERDTEVRACCGVQWNLDHAPTCHRRSQWILGGAPTEHDRRTDSSLRVAEDLDRERAAAGAAVAASLDFSTPSLEAQVEDALAGWAHLTNPEFEQVRQVHAAVVEVLEERGLGPYAHQVATDVLDAIVEVMNQ